MREVHSNTIFPPHVITVYFPHLPRFCGPGTVAIPPNTFTAAKILHIFMGLKTYTNPGMLAHLSFTTALGCRYYSHFTDEETLSKGWMTCQGHTNRNVCKQKSWDGNTGFLILSHRTSL